MHLVNNNSSETKANTEPSTEVKNLRNDSVSTLTESDASPLILLSHPVPPFEQNESSTSPSDDEIVDVEADNAEVIDVDNGHLCETIAKSKISILRKNKKIVDNC